MITLAKIYAEKELTYIHYVLWWVDIVNFCVYQFLVYVYQISNTKHTIDLSMVAGILLPNFKMGRKILSTTAERPVKKFLGSTFGWHAPVLKKIKRGILLTFWSVAHDGK